MRNRVIFEYNRPNTFEISMPMTLYDKFHIYQKSHFFQNNLIFNYILLRTFFTNERKMNIFIQLQVTDNITEIKRIF